jgi:dipeptidyl aminopeptidase/acylaminoacyl peptidase
MSRLGACAVALSLLTLAAASAYAARASTPARLVAFVQLVDNGEGEDSNATLYVAKIGSTGASRLSDYCVDCVDSPRFSPDGRWIAFQYEYADGAGIFVIRPDRSGLHRVCGKARADSSCEDYPAWSPDGRRLAFALFRGGIGVEPVAGGRMTRVPHTGSYGVTGLDWSSVGGQLAFETRFSAVNMIGIDGSHARRLAHDALGPRFSPDAGRLSFSANDYHAFYVHNRTPPRTTTTYPLEIDTPVWWDDQHLFYATGHGLYIYDLASRASTRVGPLPDVCRARRAECAEFDLQP